jgi:hypothetical protein
MYGTEVKSAAGPTPVMTLATFPIPLESRSPLLLGRCSHLVTISYLLRATTIKATLVARPLLTSCNNVLRGYFKLSGRPCRSRHHCDSSDNSI